MTGYELPAGEYLANDYDGGLVSVTTREVWRRYLALYGEPVCKPRPATAEEVARFKQAHTVVE